MACFLALAAMTGVVAAEHHRSNGLARRLEKAARLEGRLRELSERNQALARSALGAQELDRLRAEQSEVEALLAEIKARKTAEKEPSPQPGFKRTLVAECVYAGRATPEASFESVLWAASHGNVDQLAELIDLEGKVRASAQELFDNLPPSSRQEYANPRKVVATLLAASFPKDAVAASAVDERKSDGDAFLSVQVEHSEGNARTNVYHLQKQDDGWHLLIPEGVMADFEKMLVDEPDALAAAHS
jgi:hypothetical protein